MSVVLLLTPHGQHPSTAAWLGFEYITKSLGLMAFSLFLILCLKALNIRRFAEDDDVREVVHL